MPGIVLQTCALKIVNKGGGYPTKTVKESIPANPNLCFSKERHYHKHMISVKHVKGTDYVVFNCPAPDCGARNKKSVYEAKGQTASGQLAFICHKCHREIEVQRPISHVSTPDPILNNEGLRPGTLIGPNGKPIGA